MKILPLLMIAAMFFSLAGGGLSLAGDHQSSPYNGSAEFEGMKHLPSGHRSAVMAATVIVGRQQRQLIRHVPVTAVNYLRN